MEATEKAKRLSLNIQPGVQTLSREKRGVSVQKLFGGVGGDYLGAPVLRYRLFYSWVAARWCWGASLVGAKLPRAHPPPSSLLPPPSSLLPLPSSLFPPPSSRAPPRDYNSRDALGAKEAGQLRGGTRGRAFRPCASGVGGRGRGLCESGKMAAAAVVEFQRAQSLLSTDREASIDILHSIGKGRRAPSRPCWLSSACVGRRRRSGAGLAGSGAADSLCVRGAGPGAQAAPSSLQPPGSHPGGKPGGNPGIPSPAADSRWAQRQVGERAESGPHYSPAWSPGLARDREQCPSAGANWAESLELSALAKPALDWLFPPLLSA